MPLNAEVIEIRNYLERLWPILRSITGDGARETHQILSELVPLETMEIPSGHEFFDWVVPPEWVFYKAVLTGPDGQMICDAALNNLHVLNYSIPFQGEIDRAELENHLYSLPEQPDAIPYVTSYYKPRWGFCLTHSTRQALPEGKYQVHIDTELKVGSLTISECVLPGETDQEVLISSYTCHPSLGNNELSGPLTAAFLYRRLAALPNRRLTYRFVFVPETIGSILYLWLRGRHLREKLVAGYVLTCTADRGDFTYKTSRQENAACDKAALFALQEACTAYKQVAFSPSNGSDERQYCSPGFNLPIGSLMRTMYGEYPEYHTSLDNMDFICPEALQGTVNMYANICHILDGNRKLLNLFPYGEPKLDKRGLYSTYGVSHNELLFFEAVLWVLNYSDGVHDLIDIATKSGLVFDLVKQAAIACEREGLLQDTSIMDHSKISIQSLNTSKSYFDERFHEYANL